MLPALALIAWTFHATFATQPWQVALFIPSVLLAAALNFLLGGAIACAAFWTMRFHSIMRFYERVGFLFAGQVAPLTLLPGALATIGYILPFG